MSKPLNTTDGWEDLVNDVDRHNASVRIHAKIAERRRNRMIGKSINLALGAAAAAVFGATHIIAGWLAALLAILLLCGACVIAGRVFEQAKGR